MTREQYEQRLQTLGSFAELMPPWPVVEETMKLCPVCDNLGYIGCFCGQVKNAEVERLERDDLRHKYEAAVLDGDRYAWSMDQARHIARALLQHSDFSPSQVRARWPEDAEWLLGDNADGG